MAHSHASARWQTGLGLAGPFVAALLLPSPAGQIAVLTDPRPDVVVGAIAMLLAIAVTWLLAAWSATVCAAAVFSRAPGVTGALARRILGGITPALMRRVMMTAAGLSVAAGLAACGTSTPSHALLSPEAAVAASAPTAAPSADVPGRSAEAQPLPGIDLDWPVTTPIPEAPTDATAPDEPAVAAEPPMTEPSGPTTTPGMGTDTGDPTDATPDLPAYSPAGPRAATPAQLPPAPRTEHAASGASPDVIVRPGDSLWSIAADHLPPGATAAQIDAAWRTWYRVNRDVIGDDPNLITPGQHLTAAPSATSAPDGAASAPTH